MNVDLLVKDVQVFNSYFKRFIKGNAVVKDGKFYYIGEHNLDSFEPSETVDGNGKYMVPGLVDIHLHIESTMVTPATFSYGLIKNGVTTIVPEPHEMANVFGISGVKEMIEASKECVADMFYAIPSSVPATSMETTGGSIEISDIDDLLQSGMVHCLGEIMNYYEVITDPDCKTNQILAHIKKHYPELIIEGHVPKLLDLELQKIIFAGIDSDHTHQTVEGMEARIASGMFLEIQEKSMTKEVIDYLLQHQVDEHFCFVTDDVMADNFKNNGHLNKLLQKAIQMGMTPEKAIYACTLSPAKRMRMYDRGVIAPGKIADFLLVSDLESFEIDKVFKSGVVEYDSSQAYIQAESERQFPEHFYQSVTLDTLSRDDFEIEVGITQGQCDCRIINVEDGSTFTKESIGQVKVEAGRLCWEESPYALVATFERYGKNGNAAHGLITGDLLKRGAVATTYSHDNHNLLVVGHNKEDMMLAANEVIRKQGGICCVDNGKILSMLELPVGGVLSEEPLEVVGAQVEQLTATLKSLGYKHYNVIMSLSTLSLPVSPALKITDQGLIRVNEGQIVPLVVDGE